MSVTIELPKLQLNDLFEKKTSRLKYVSPVIEAASNLVIGVGIKPTFNGTKAGKELRKIVHGTPCCR